MFDRLISIVQSYRKGYTVILRSKLNSDLLNWIKECTLQLIDTKYKLVTKIYWIFNDIHEIPVCRRPECHNLLENVCGLANGYGGGYCSSYCAANDDNLKQKRRLLAEQKYGKGITCYQKTKVFRSAASKRMLSREDSVRQNTITQMKKTWKSKSKAEIQKIVTKREKTCMTRYGVRVSSQSDQVKAEQAKTNVKKYGAISPLANPEIRSLFDYTAINLKRVETKRAHHTFTTSQAEEEVYQLLCTYFGKDNIKRQYKTLLYPFLCDFYIVSKDLYIEFQGSWTHGFKPFDKNDESCQQLLKKWTERSVKQQKTKHNFYLTAIYVWTDLDVRKRNIAITNKLNYLEFFTIQQVKEWLNSTQQ